MLFIKVTETELATVSNYLPTFCREFNFTDLFLGTSKRMRLVKVSFLAQQLERRVKNPFDGKKNSQYCCCFVPDGLEEISFPYISRCIDWVLVFACSSVKDWKLLILFIYSVLTQGVNTSHP